MASDMLSIAGYSRFSQPHGKEHSDTFEAILFNRTLSFAQAVLAAGVDRTKEDDEMPARLANGHLHLFGVLHVVPVRHHELADVLLVFFGVNVQEDRVCTLPMDGILAPTTFISVVCCSARQPAVCDSGESVQGSPGG